MFINCLDEETNRFNNCSLVLAAVWTRHKDEGGGKDGQKKRGVIGEEQIRQSMRLRRQRCRGKNFKFVARRRGSVDRLIDRNRSRIDRSIQKFSWNSWDSWWIGSNEYSFRDFLVIFFPPLDSFFHLFHPLDFFFLFFFLFFYFIVLFLLELRLSCRFAR